MTHTLGGATVGVPAYDMTGDSLLPDSQPKSRLHLCELEIESEQWWGEFWEISKTNNLEKKTGGLRYFQIAGLAKTPAAEKPHHLVYYCFSLNVNIDLLHYRQEALGSSLRIRTSFTKVMTQDWFIF